MTNEPIQTIERLPALLRYWRWRSGLSAAVPGLALGGLLLLISLRAVDAESALRKGLWPAFVALVALGFVLGWRYAGLRFDHYRAEHHLGEGVVLYSGVWWRSEVWVPTARLQHLDVSQGPLDRRWGMATLSLHTAGSHDQHTRIHGLPLDQAHALRERLMPKHAIQHE